MKDHTSYQASLLRDEADLYKAKIFEKKIMHIAMYRDQTCFESVRTCCLCACVCINIYLYVLLVILHLCYVYMHCKRNIFVENIIYQSYYSVLYIMLHCTKIYLRFNAKLYTVFKNTLLVR